MTRWLGSSVVVFAAKNPGFEAPSRHNFSPATIIVIKITNTDDDYYNYNNNNNDNNNNNNNNNTHFTSRGHSLYQSQVNLP